jgi:hypothetical protein
MCRTDEDQNVATILDQDLITLAEAAKQLPKIRGQKKPIAPSTLWRWATAGCRAKDGVIVRLEVWQLGNRHCTTMDALERFTARLNALPAPPSAKRQKKVEAALAAVGL